MSAALTPQLQALLNQATGARSGWRTQLGWALLLGVLVWAWQGAEMRPLDLIRDAGNMRTFARDFFPPDFHDWRIYLKELLVTLHIAVWGTVLAIVAAVPLGLLSAHNVAPAWVYQPVRRLMDACRAINEMVFAMLFIVAVGLGPFAGVLALFVHTTGTLAKLFAEAVGAFVAGGVLALASAGLAVWAVTEHKGSVERSGWSFQVAPVVGSREGGVVVVGRW